jgi:hypothetical protein
MKLRISKTLKSWVDVAWEQGKREAPDTSKNALIAEVLHEWEETGDAMRYLRGDGKIGWKATAGMLGRLSDAEHEAKDEFEDWE